MNKSERILEAMEKLNISGYRVQKDLGISQGTITNYRKGIYQPRQKTIEEFAKTYGVNITWLLTGQGDMKGGKPIPAKSIRFLKVIEQIKIDHDVSNKDLAEQLESYASLISELKAGKTSVKDEWIDILVHKYGVNKEYLNDGTGGVYLESVTDGRTYRELMKEVELLRKMVHGLQKDKEFLMSIITESKIKF